MEEEGNNKETASDAAGARSDAVAMLGEKHDVVLHIFNTHRPAITRFLKRTLTSSEEVADALQEIYLRLSRLPDVAALEKSPRAYMFRIATNLVHDDVRKKYTRHARQHFVYEEEELEGESPTPEDQVSQNQQLALLKAACDRLDPQERRVFFLHRIHELTYQQIAKETGVSARTVRRWVVQTLSFLQEQVKGHG